MPRVNARVAHLLLVHRMMPMEVGDSQKGKFDMNDNDQLMYAQECRNYRAFLFPYSSSEDREGMYMGECINVMVQALQTQDGSLPQGLTVQNTLYRTHTPC